MTGFAVIHPTAIRSVHRRRDETGSAVVELPLIVVVFMLLLWLGYGGIRLAAVRGDVQAAAWASARSASGSYSAAAGIAEARAVADDMLASHQSQRCSSVNVATTGSWSPGGQVSVTVTCVVSLSEVTGVGFGASRTYQATAVEQIEWIRGGT